MADIHKLPGNWDMDDGETLPEHPRYIWKKNDAKEHVNFRAPETLIRFIDEYVASHIDPFCRTRSDVFNDALLGWVMAHKDEHQSLSIMAMNIQATYRAYELESHDEALQQIEKIIDRCVKSRNKKRLREVLDSMEKSRPIMEREAGEVQVEELDRLISRVKEILG